MRVSIFVSKTCDSEWSVTIDGGTPHKMRRLPGTAKECFFPESENGGVLTAARAEELRVKIFTNDATADQGSELGEHLFDCLIGTTKWTAIRERAKASETTSIELALEWDGLDPDLTALPWELMKNGDGFLTSQEVAITRLVKSDSAELPVLTPKVLFVVGAELTDANVRPGGEYLGLVKRMHGKNVSLNTRVLVPKNLLEIGKTIEEFNPSVVHFIGHGRKDRDKGVLVVSVPDQDNRMIAHDFDAVRIKEQWLDKAGNIPIFVLNACQSAAQPTAVDTVPLALQLVQLGVPLVVGMSGRVSDAACRYFCWKLYESLLTGFPIPLGVARARMAAGITNTKLGDNPHWAFPVLFMRTDVPNDIKLDSAFLTQWSKQSSIGAQYNHLRNPLLYCGRIDAQNEFYRILSDDRCKILAAEVANPDQQETGPKYGKSRFLREIAEQAVLNGHLVIMMSLAKGDNIPSSWSMFALYLRQAIRVTRERFGCGPKKCDHLQMMVNWEKDRSVVLESSLQSEFDDAMGQNLDAVIHKMYGMAFRLDAIELKNDAPKWCRHVILMIDDLHRFDKIAYEFLSDFLTDYGAGDSVITVPLVFTFSDNTETKSSCNLALDAINEYVRGRRHLVRTVVLEPFRGPDQFFEYLPYQQFLLSLEPPLVAAPRDESTAFDCLHEEIQGIPSRMGLKAKVKDGLEAQAEANLVAVIAVCVKFNHLIKASEEAQLQTLIQDKL